MVDAAQSSIAASPASFALSQNTDSAVSNFRKFFWRLKRVSWNSRYFLYFLRSLRSVEGNDDLSPQLDSLSLVNGEPNVTSLKENAKKEASKTPVEAPVLKASAVQVDAPKMKPAVVERQAATKHQEEKPKLQEKKVDEAPPSRIKEFPEPTEQPKTVSSLRLQEFRRNMPQQPVKAQEQTRIVFSDLQVRPLPTTAFKGTLLSGDPDTKLFSICQQENFEYLSKIEACIAEHLAVAAKTPYTPKKGEMVLAKFQGTFYRGTCKEKSADGYLVNYIDYGNSDVVKEEDIRAFDKKLMFDVVVHSVLLENFPEVIDEKMAALLEGDGVPLKNARRLKDGYVACIDGL